MREWKGAWQNGRYWALAIALAAVLGLSAPEVQARGNDEIALHTNAGTVQQRYLVPGGKSLGIAIETDGLVVVGTSDLGVDASPARLAGLESGDIITEANGVALRSADDLAQVLRAGEQASLQVVNDHKMRTVQLTPASDPRDGSPRIGAWVRSSTAGVGTLTYVDPLTGEFAALGHPIADIDTGILLPVAEGEIYNSRIAQINPSKRGQPGEIVGDFLGEESAIGSVHLNSDYGVFGDSYTGSLNELPYSKGLPVAERSQVRTGEAQLLTTLDDEIRAYDCEIEHIDSDDRHDTRSMVVRITDKELLSRTGGIVQGMSGSPIVQNGKLVGAVTHVLVNDPTRGYGIFIENMLEAAE